jgi:hypothetical protein
VKVLADKMMRAVGDNMRDGEGLVFTYLAVQEAFEPFARAYVALAERVGVLEEALSQLEGKARLGGDCLGNSPPNFEPCQRSFYMLADIARAALTPKASGDEQEIG